MKPLKIREKLFIGDIHSASNEHVLKSFGIKAIVDVG
jgi:hypothetical protein